MPLAPSSGSGVCIVRPIAGQRLGHVTGSGGFPTRPRWGELGELTRGGERDEQEVAESEEQPREVGQYHLPQRKDKSTEDLILCVSAFGVQIWDLNV